MVRWSAIRYCRAIAAGLYEGCGLKSGGVPRRGVGDCIRLGAEKFADSFFTPTILNQ